MRVKKYRGPNMPEVMKKIRSDLGSEAIILNSKEVKSGGILGIFKKKHIEVVAALDSQPLPDKFNNRRKNLRNNHMHLSINENNHNENHMNSTVLKEIKNLRKVLELQSTNDHHAYSPNYQMVYQHLLDQEVHTTLAKTIIDAVVSKYEKEHVNLSVDDIIHKTQLEIEERLTNVSFKTDVTHHQRIIHFVGPTGVGKTTTLAKIAAKMVLEDHKKVAFITKDTYRIAAIEQLKTYARILDVPVEVAYSTADYFKAVEKYKAYDQVLVDTAGRNFRDEQYINDLKLNQDPNIKTYLVLALTAKPKDIIEIYDQFAHLPINEVIFTKIDETTQFGSMLNISLTNNVSVSYVTNGQDVPEDLFKPTPGQISNYILGEYVEK